jgi:hypothetical protein
MLVAISTYNSYITIIPITRFKKLEGKMKKNRLFILLIVLGLILSTASVGFAAIDYDQWNSNSAYPKDLVGTPLLTQARAFIDKGIITGYKDGLFHPERSINRAEYATIMAKATNNTSGIAAAAKQNHFGDLKGYGWAKGYINVCYDAGLINGIGKSKYNPGGSVTYVEVIAVVLRSKGITDATINQYGKWPNNYIKYAEIFNMDGALMIRDWTAPANRGDVVQLLYRNMPKSTVSAATVNVSSLPTSPVSTGAVTFTATATGTGTHSFQWYYNNGVIAGATSSTYTTSGSGPVITSPGAYHVNVKTTRPGYNDTTKVSADIIVK